MAEPLKNAYGREIPTKIARTILNVHPRFPVKQFMADVLDGYDALELMPRGWKIADALKAHLPGDYGAAVEVLLASVASLPPGVPGNGAMASFFFMPHTCFVARYGLDHFDISMEAQYELTQRFTAEFSIRPYLERHQTATLARLEEWAKDPNPKVRRLVSEGTRPRLPWAPRLRAFQANPEPVVRLLELLKDDPELYVRRSVANNLNDIGKDHPELLFKVARRWLKDASENRRWIVNHALRFAVKQKQPGALAALGFGAVADVKVCKAHISPQRISKKSGAPCGVTIEFDIHCAGSRPQRILVDLEIHFVKASGSTKPKVFKIKTLNLSPGECVHVSKFVSLQEMTTRKHYPGKHPVDALINGNAIRLGHFRIEDRGC